ncbi:ubiquitin-like protein Pup [Alloscardovia venturai]|uniref:Prokaryotic ubiquitin-like protein Pup n=1 Tax=Alloscardovia venturai TaxID=1769421 RepID=A0ABW2Y7F0_9BIFI
MPQELHTHQTHSNSQQHAEGTHAVRTVQLDTQMHDAADNLDAILDDIEATLEENAEDYVNSFVQKGGQ